MEHTSASDAALPEDGAVPVTIGDVEGYLRQLGPDRFEVRWALGDTQVELRSFGLDEDEVVAFARDLRPRDADGVLSFPLEPGDELGFEATTRPRGIEEDAVALPPRLVDYRWTAFERPGSRVEVDVTNAGERAFDDIVTTRLVHDLAVEPVEVPALDRTALLFREHPDPAATGGDAWHLVWRQDDAVVVVSMWALDREQVGEVVGGLRLG